MARQRRIWLCREGIYYTAVFLAVLIGAVSRQLNLLMLLGCVLSGPLLFHEVECRGEPLEMIGSKKRRLPSIAVSIVVPAR